MGLNLEDGYWKMFTIVVQLPAILSLLIYFRTRLKEFFSTFPQGLRGDRTAMTHPATLILIAFLCTAIPSFLLKKLISKNLESISGIGWALVMGGIIMWIVDYVYRPIPGKKAKTRRLDVTTISQAVWIGLCQNFSAVFPGTSRSMATIAAGQICGMSRPVALEFSFLVSIPTMLAATGYELLKALMGKGEGASGSIHIDGHGFLLLLIGGTLSFAVAYLAVSGFMSWVRTRGFAVFAAYRIIAGALVIYFAKQLGGGQ
jgi:undecaprenyl-diphosphatase